MARLKVGLLGGSFNPAHVGHRHISLLALKQLQLDQIWWLVSPQNPLKPHSGMLPFKERQASAQIIARHPRIRVTDLEIRLGTCYTIDTLERLHCRWPNYRFVWLMGADNLIQLPRWRRWREIVQIIPIAIFNRDQAGHRSGGSGAGPGQTGLRGRARMSPTCRTQIQAPPDLPETPRVSGPGERHTGRTPAA